MHVTHLAQQSLCLFLILIITGKMTGCKEHYYILFHKAQLTITDFDIHFTLTFKKHKAINDLLLKYCHNPSSYLHFLFIYRNMLAVVMQSFPSFPTYNVFRNT
jgi:hypothetical protein